MASTHTQLRHGTPILKIKSITSLRGLQTSWRYIKKSYMFCDITPCSPFILKRRFGGTISPPHSTEDNTRTLHNHRCGTLNPTTRFIKLTVFRDVRLCSMIAGAYLQNYTASIPNRK